jgi:hypothetical protein
VTEQASVFTTVLDVLERNQIPYMITGSVASVLYGEPRMTLDMDIVLDIAPHQVRPFVQAFGNDYYVDETSIRDAIQRRWYFNIIHGSSGAKVDFYVVQDTPYAREAFGRRRNDQFSHAVRAYFTSAEDTIIGKLQYYHDGGSEKHLRDIRGILRSMPAKLDMGYLDKWATDLGLAEEWAAVLSKKE